MLIAIGALVVLVAGLAFMLVRVRGERDALVADLGVSRQEVERLGQECSGLRDALGAAERSRAAAEERETRVRRDATAVAERMQAEIDARTRLEGERTELADALSRAEAALADGDEAAFDDLWAGALEDAQRTWEVSVCPSPGFPSPLADTDDALRTAVEIEIDAAREESGALIELDFVGDTVAAPPVALRALSIVQTVVGRLAKADLSVRLRLTSNADGVIVTVHAEREASELDVALAGVAPELAAEGPTPSWVVPGLATADQR